MKKEYPRDKDSWLEKKGKSHLVCYESNMVNVSRNTCRIGSSSVTNVSNSIAITIVHLMVICSMIMLLLGLWLCNNGTKYCVIKGKSSILWHLRFGYISIERIKRLVDDGVL